MTFQIDCSAKTTFIKKVSAVAIVFLATGLFGSVATQAANVTVTVTDGSGHPLADAAVYAEPTFGVPMSKIAHKVEIEQKDRAFLPLVTVAQVGSEISFPNHDTVRHQVYSFSSPKVFELKLYAGIPSAPVLFDKAGTVVLGCNIHDQMLAYIHIVPTPFFGKTDSTGKVRLDGLPTGVYRLKAWHFNLPTGAVIPEQALDVAADGAVSIKLNTKVIR
jgi:plastocyanin